MDRSVLVVVSLLASSTSFASLPPALDFGDAPDPTYPSLLASDGASHDITTGGAYLGAQVDDELDGFSSLEADGDDLDAFDDEDGVVFASELLQGEVALVDVTASGATLLDAWIDFDANGSWEDAGEQIFTSEPLAAGVNSLDFSIPASAALGNTYARFRCSSAGGLGPQGHALTGEVEDYLVLVPEPAGKSLGVAALLALVSMAHRRQVA
ncbi:MAG: hypothetical protein JRG96_03965 [Deltaproteobacteria bacterium]|nr:hypothetical protein [Deltaproteobacteria bacterium]